MGVCVVKKQIKDIPNGIFSEETGGVFFKKKRKIMLFPRPLK